MKKYVIFLIYLFIPYSALAFDLISHSYCPSNQSGSVICPQAVDGFAECTYFAAQWLFELNPGTYGETCAQPDPTCSDNTQNQGETGIDCGGPCPACFVGCETTYGWVNDGTGLYQCRNISGAPTGCALNLAGPVIPDASCAGIPNPGNNDNIKNPNEDGIDCGGSNPAACSAACPSGYVDSSQYGRLDHALLGGLLTPSVVRNSATQCVKLNPLSGILMPCPEDQIKIVYALEPCNPGGGSCPGSSGSCASFATSILAAAEVPQQTVDVYFETLPPTQQPSPDSAISAPAPNNSDVQQIDGAVSSGCVDKTFSDGTICTTCQDSTGKQSITCVGPNGSVTSTKSPVTVETPEGCKEITYSNGQVCTVCRNADGLPTVNCVDGAGVPVAPAGGAENAGGDAILGSIEKKIGGVGRGIDDVSAGVGQLNTGMIKSNILDTKRNEYLKTIAEKDTNVTVNMNTAPIVTELQTANTGIAGIWDQLKPATAEQVDATKASIDSQIDSALTAKADAQNDDIQQLMTDFDPSYFGPFEGLKDKIKAVLPAPGACEALVIQWTPTQQTVFPCEPFLKFKELFGYVLYAWTTLQVVGLLFSAKFYGQA